MGAVNTAGSCQTIRFQLKRACVVTKQTWPGAAVDLAEFRLKPNADLPVADERSKWQGGRDF